MFIPVSIRYTNSMLIAEFKNEFKGELEYFEARFLQLIALRNSFQIKGSDMRTKVWIIKRLFTAI